MMRRDNPEAEEEYALQILSREIIAYVTRNCVSVVEFENPVWGKKMEMLLSSILNNSGNVSSMQRLSLTLPFSS